MLIKSSLSVLGKTTMSKGDRILLIIGPKMIDCHAAAVAFSLDPRALCNIRNVTKAAMLRGITRGTPFIAVDRDQWHRTAEGHALALMVNHLEMTCQIRPMRADERTNYQERVFA